MSGKHTRKAVITAMGLAAVLSLTACNGDEYGGADTPDASSASVGGAAGSASSGSSGGSSGSNASGSGGSSGSSSGGSSTSSGGEGGGSDAGSATDICRTGRMQIDAVDNSTDGKEGVVTVSLKNTGSGPCRIKGYAGVDLKTGDGDTVSLDRNGDAAPSNVLAGGETAAFNIYYPKNDSGGTGVRPTTIVVTAPDDTAQATVAWPGGSIPVTGDSGGGLEISPVAKVG